MSNDDKVKVRFLEDYTVKDERRGTPQAESYQKGKTYTLSAASATHFVTRGRAEII